VYLAQGVEPGVECAGGWGAVCRCRRWVGQWRPVLSRLAQERNRAVNLATNIWKFSEEKENISHYFNIQEKEL